MVSRRVIRRRRFFSFLLLVGLVVLLVSCWPKGTGKADLGPFAPEIALPEAVAGLTTEDLTYGSVAELADPAWVKKTAKATGIPERALTAYAGVALGLSAADPECHLSWNTLAGVGWVESHHGTIFGGKILPDGTTSEEIYGIPLDGANSTKALPDFDDGNFDGTAEFDRAVGPMQIIPPTWAAWERDGNNDGNMDGHNIDDAALAAGSYLCYSGGNLSTREGWQDALYSYNQAEVYSRDVADKANEYARLAAQ